MGEQEVRAFTFYFSDGLRIMGTSGFFFFFFSGIMGNIESICVGEKMVESDVREIYCH